MIYGGVLDIMVYFERTLPFAPPGWHIIDTRISLICGIFIVLAAVYLVLKSFEIKSIVEEKREIKQSIRALLMVCVTGTIADLIAGYYARGFLLGLLGTMYLNYALTKKKKAQYLCLSSVVVAIIITGFIWTGGK